MTIAEVSKKFDLSQDTLRYYDDDIIGLYQGSTKTMGFAGIVLFFNPKKGNLSHDKSKNSDIIV